MTTLANVLKAAAATKQEKVNDDIVSSLAKDINYIKRSSMIVSDALQKGSDIMQLANGDILITEVKTVTYKYSWNNSKGRFERANNGHRAKKTRKNKVANSNE